MIFTGCSTCFSILQRIKRILVPSNGPTNYGIQSSATLYFFLSNCRYCIHRSIDANAREYLYQILAVYYTVVSHAPDIKRLVTAFSIKLQRLFYHSHPLLYFPRCFLPLPFLVVPGPVYVSEILTCTAEQIHASVIMVRPCSFNRDEFSCLSLFLSRQGQTRTVFMS